MMQSQRQLSLSFFFDMYVINLDSYVSTMKIVYSVSNLLLLKQRIKWVSIV